MKKLTLGVLMLMAVIVTSCKKDSDNSASASGAATVTAGNYGFDNSASLGKFSSTKAGITQTTVGGVSTFTITAIKDGSNESITLVLLQKITAVGKITFGSSLSKGGLTLSKDYTKPADLSLNYSSDRNSGFNASTGGGELNVTKLDGNKIEGTFYAVVYTANGREAFVEQGSFSGTIQ
jgi:hypothetical protein